MSQSARSKYLAKVKIEKTEQARAASVQEALDMAQAVIDVHQKENEMSKTPGLGRMDVIKANVKRRIKKIQKAIKNLVRIRRVEKIKANVKASVKNHFQTYKTVYIAVPVSVLVGAAIVFVLTRKGGLGSLKGVGFTKFTYTNLSNEQVNEFIDAIVDGVEKKKLVI